MADNLTLWPNHRIRKSLPKLVEPTDFFASGKTGAYPYSEAISAIFVR